MYNQLTPSNTCFWNWMAKLRKQKQGSFQIYRFNQRIYFTWFVFFSLSTWKWKINNWHCSAWFLSNVKWAPLSRWCNHWYRNEHVGRPPPDTKQLRREERVNSTFKINHKLVRALCVSVSMYYHDLTDKTLRLVRVSLLLGNRMKSRFHAPW